MYLLSFFLERKDTFMRRSSLLSLIALGSLLFFLLGNAALAITDPVESNYVLTAKEMVQSGNWISPQIFSTYWYDKPIFIYWLLSLSYSLFGFTDFASRLPGAVFGMGSVVFMADLMRAVQIPCAIDFMVVSSYGGANTSSTGLVKIIKDLDADLTGRDVLIVEDILDTGITLSKLVPVLKMRNPGSVKICTILSKPSRRMADIEPDYCGFEVPDEFVVGYGLDYDEKYRNLPYVGVLKPEVYSGE